MSPRELERIGRLLLRMWPTVGTVTIHDGTYWVMVADVTRHNGLDWHVDMATLAQLGVL